MQTNNDPTASPLYVFMFSYHEHDWTVEDEDEARAEILRRARDEKWLPIPDLDEKQAELYCSAETLDALEQMIRATIVEEWNMPAEAVTLPLAELRKLLAQDGWRFVGGSFDEFEGHHNDSEIHVVLTKRDPPVG